MTPNMTWMNIAVDVFPSVCWDGCPSPEVVLEVVLEVGSARDFVFERWEMGKYQPAIVPAIKMTGSRMPARL
jgi:hypothetical protein